jgi:hypothetical protein
MTKRKINVLRHQNEVNEYKLKNMKSTYIKTKIKNQLYSLVFNIYYVI